MGLEPPYSMQWGKGSNIKFGFEHLDASVPDLRKGLTWNCAEAPTYKVKDGIIYSESTDQEVAYTVIWPSDYSVFYVHRMEVS